MDDTFVAVACGTGFIRIYPWNKDEPVGHFVVEFCEPADIVADRVFVVCGTGAYDDEQFIASACEDVAYLSVPFRFFCSKVRGHGILLPDFVGGGEFSDEGKAHFYFLLCRFCFVDFARNAIIIVYKKKWRKEKFSIVQRCRSAE